MTCASGECAVTCGFRLRAVCERVAEFVCTLCGDRVCAKHASREFHFNVRRIEK